MRSNHFSNLISATSESPLVSVILPTYNRASILNNSIEAVLKQTYHKLELIIIDDGSTDETKEMIAKVADPRVHYLRIGENKGVANARNEGISSSHGEVLAFADSDDIWLPGKLDSQVEIFTKFPHLELLFADYLNINHITNIRDYGFRQNSKGLKLLKTVLLTENCHEIITGAPEALLRSNFIATPTVLIRSSVITKIGNFNATLMGGSDFEFWWRASVSGIQFAYQTIPWIERNKIDDSITATNISFSPRLLQSLEACTEIAKKSNQPGLIPHLRKAQHRAWSALIWAHGRRGERKQALVAFKKSLTYGNSFQVWIYIFLSLIGGSGIKRLKKIRNKIKPTLTRAKSLCKSIINSGSKNSLKVLRGIYALIRIDTL